MTEMREKVRGLIREIVSSLQQVDDRLAVLAESLPLPPDATEMWESEIPTSAIAYVYAALEAVRSDYIQEAIEALVHASRQSDLSLRREFLMGRPVPYPGPDNRPLWGLASSGISDKGGVPFRKHQDPGESAGRKEPPPC